MYNINDLRILGSSPWDHKLTELKGVLRKVSRKKWLPREDKRIGIITDAEYKLCEKSVTSFKCEECESVKCEKFHTKHGYKPCEFLFLNQKSIDWYYGKRK